MGQRQSEIIKNHMEVYWHDYASASKGIPITEAGLVEKASVIGRTGLMLLECGTGAWRVRSSMNTLSRELGVTTTADIGLLSIEFTCFDGDQCYTQSLCLTNTGVNTSRLNRLEHFVNDFDREGKFMTGEELHSHLDEIERIHGLYSPTALGFAAALACGCFTFLLGGGPIEMLFAFCGAGIGNFVRCKLTKHHFTLFLGITASVCSASLVYAVLLKLAEVLFAVSIQHEAGYICSILPLIPMKSLTVWRGHSTRPSLPAGTARKARGSLPRGRQSRLIMQTTKNRKFPLGNSLLYISLSSVAFGRVRPIQGRTLFFVLPLIF